MLTAKFTEDNEIETSGTVLEGDVYQDMCCEGYAWEVLFIMPFEGDDSIWGHCENPRCPQHAEDPFDYYHGISIKCLQDLEVLIAEHED